MSTPRTDRLAPAPSENVRQIVSFGGGGSVISMLGAWRAHGLDRICASAGRLG